MPRAWRLRRSPPNEPTPVQPRRPAAKPSLPPIRSSCDDLSTLDFFAGLFDFGEDVFVRDACLDDDFLLVERDVMRSDA